MKNKINKKNGIFVLISLLGMTLIVLTIVFTLPPKTVEKDGGLIFNLKITSPHPTEKQIDTTLKILRKRINSVCYHNPSVLLSQDKKDILVKLPLEKDISLYKDFILGRKDVEVREFYNNDYFYNFLNNVDLELINKNFYSEKTKKDILINNFFMLLRPYQNKWGGLISGPIVGFSWYEDTALVSEIITGKAFSSFFPRDLELKWVNFRKNNCSLMALKVIPGNERVSTKMISNAKIWKDPNGNYQVMVKVKAKNIKNIANLTRNNIGKPLAIIFNNQLMGYPTVTCEIKIGAFSIFKDKMGKRDAKAIVATINSGRIPIHFRVKNIQIVKKPR